MGIWLVAFAWVLPGHTDLARRNNVIVGALLIPISFKRGVIKERFGEWTRYLI
jgi:hypothetical protein